MAWDYYQTDYEKQAKADEKWRLERLINYGLRGNKLNKEILGKYLPELNITEDQRAFLELILWDKKF